MSIVKRDYTNFTKSVTKVVTSPISAFSGKISFFLTSLLLRSEWCFGLLERDLDRDRFLSETSNMIVAF